MPNLLIIGGSDAGISAALRAKEIDPVMDITVLVANRFPNYSNQEFMDYIAQKAPNNAQKVLEKYELLFKIGSDVQAVTILGRKANLLILINDYVGAAETLRHIEEIRKKQVFLTPQNLGSCLQYNVFWILYY